MNGTLNPICIGVDVGQISDPTAICVVEISEEHTGKFRTGSWPSQTVYPIMASRYTVRHIQRLALGTPYPKVAEHVAGIICSDRLADRDITTLIDVTGVGRPVYEDIQKEISFRQTDAWIRPITFTGGMQYNRSTGALAKAYLVSRLQSLLQGNHVHAPDTSEVRAMLEELRVYEIKISQDGHDSYGAVTGKHDDLVTAMGLACLEDPFEQQAMDEETARAIRRYVDGPWY